MLESTLFQAANSATVGISRRSNRYFSIWDTDWLSRTNKVEDARERGIPALPSLAMYSSASIPLGQRVFRLSSGNANPDSAVSQAVFMG